MPKCNLENLPANAVETEFRTHQLIRGRDEMIDLEGIFLAYASKRTSEATMGDASPVAMLKLFLNTRGDYVLAFQKTEADGTPIIGSLKTFPRLEKLAEKVPCDKMHRRICDLMGVRHLMADMTPTAVN